MGEWWGKQFKPPLIDRQCLVLGYGRSQDWKRTALGAQYSRSGYDPKAKITVIGALKNQELPDIEAAKQEGREPRRYHGLLPPIPTMTLACMRLLARQANTRLRV
jgi:predicted Zn-dependent protease